ncbi:MAG: choice-of-anchor D domain-containing protein, partial [Thermoguttaceae bacterium]|nr:choice-of-anchor D domain-containing protein [Thermoguttaceae bacterium]
MAGAVTAGAEITVLWNSTAIADGDTTPSAGDGTDFGSVPQGGNAVSRTFTVRNDGGQTLTLGSVSVPSGFRLAEGLVASLGPGASDTFMVELTTGTAGSFSGDVSFATNDSDENPFNFRIRGVVGAQGLRQIVSDAAATHSVAPGAQVQFPVRYVTSDNDSTLTGLGLRMHYDSRKLQFGSLVNVLQTGLIGQQAPVDDAQDFDADPSTDKYVLVSWADINGQWPGANLPQKLFDANFTLASGLAHGTSTAVNFTASSTAAGYAFESRPITVLATACSLDVDGNGRADPLTDGLLIVRYLFGFSGDDLVRGALAPDATRTDPDAIRQYLDACCPTMLDVDDNGVQDALTDGLLILRYLFGFRGPALTNGAIGPGARRTTPEEIVRFLDGFLPPGCGTQRLAAAGGDETLVGFGIDRDAAVEMVDFPHQAVEGVPSTQVVGANAGVAIDVNYTTEPVNSSLTGLGLRMHFNSSLLVFAALDNVLQNGLIGQQPPVDDVQDFDGDPSTDKYVLVSWADINGQWPGGSLPTRLFTARFTSGSPVEDTTTRVNFTASSAAAGWEFVPTPAEVGIDVTGPSVTVDQAPGQADPTNASPVVFRVTFSEPVSGFDTSDLTLGGTAGATTTEITPVGSGNTTFDVSVSGMTQTGTVVLSVADGAAVDAVGNPSQAPTLVDNTVTFTQVQAVKPTPLTQTVGGNAPVSIDVNYTTEPVNSSLTGLGLRMHFNSSLLVFAALDDVLQNGLIGQQPPVDDVQDFDGDPSTDKYVLVSWADINGQWPGGSLPTRLFTARFTSGSPVEDTTTRVNFTASSAAAGWEFVPTPAEVGIDVTGPSVTVDQAPGQADPTSDSPVVFRVTFSEPVSGFDTSDLTLGGTAGATTTEITPVGSGNTTFDVSVSGMTQTGTVVLSVADGAAVDAVGNPSQAPTLVDNTVTFTQVQAVKPTPLTQTVGGNAPVSIDVNYTTEPVNSSLTGLGLR